MTENTYELPTFVRGQDYWPIPETGDWSADCAVGRAAAADACRVMHFHGVTPVLGFVVKAMVERGRFGGVETGFCQGIAEAMGGD